jgi:hypothetical protein
MSSSTVYDPCVWDTLQAILNDIIDGNPYEFSSFVPESIVSIDNRSTANILDEIEILLQALNEPNYVQETRSIQTNGLAALIAAADTCFNNEISSCPMSKSIP